MQPGKYNIKGDKKQRTIVALHVLIWLIVFLMPYIFNADVDRGAKHKGNDDSEFLHLNTALDFFWVAIFYFNASFLIPRLIYTRKIALYVLAILIMFGIVILFDDIFFHVFSIPRNFSVYHSIEHNIIPFAFTLAVSAAYKAIADKTKADAIIRDKQNENLTTELSFLRSQISPHFIFNVLNNMSALARLKSDDLEPTIVKLSSILQYMLYETDEEKVLLRSEAEYLKSYIDLQQQRYGDELILKVLFDIKEEWHSIEPMLLIPYVENAFKHGGALQNPEIHISLTVVENKLQFEVKNKFIDNNATKDRTSGIGLANVTRRLELLYPGKHQLTIKKKDEWFIVSLALILK
jgi:two-component system LytT family sensor kinase